MVREPTDVARLLKEGVGGVLTLVLQDPESMEDGAWQVDGFGSDALEKAWLKQQFALADADGDGTLSNEELLGYVVLGPWGIGV